MLLVLAVVISQVDWCQLNCFCFWVLLLFRVGCVVGHEVEVLPAMLFSLLLSSLPPSSSPVEIPVEHSQLVTTGVPFQLVSNGFLDRFVQMNWSLLGLYKMVCNGNGPPVD